MDKFIEKLIGRLEEEKERANRHYNYGDETAYRHSIEIANQLAEEHNGGWIPCSGCEDCQHKECEHYGNG